jgi:glutaminase
MKLKQLPYGQRKVDDVAHYNIVSIARIGKEWFALNRKSEDPMNLRNRELRAAWAKPQGIATKDVENYVRKIRRQRATEHAQRELEDAKLTLSAHGYTVTKGSKR